MSTTYTTRGPVRRGCGHKHRSIKAALDCIHRDSVFCRRTSDRSIRRTDGEPLSQREQDEIEYLEREAG